MISSITTAKGTAVMITSDCSPCSAVSPPSSSITTAMPPITRPQGKDHDQLRRALAALGGEDAHHHGGGVRSGDEEDRQDEHDQDRQELGEGQALHHREQHLGRVHRVHLAQGAVAIHRDRGAAHDPVGQEQQRGGDEDDSEHELADGPAAGDPGDEDAHEGRPRDPPGPVVHGPRGLEVEGVLAPGGRAPHELEQRAEVSMTPKAAGSAGTGWGPG